MEDPAHQKMALAQRLSLLDAINTALDQRDGVLRVIAESQDEAAANRAVQWLLGIDEFRADAVLALQWHRLTRAGRARIAEEQLEVKRQLDQAF